MIGAANSPMSMFTGGGNDAFQRGMMIGSVNSPATAIGNALKGTLDKYNAHLSAQQEQQNKLAQINATSQASLNNDKAMLDYKRQGAINIPDPDAQGPFTQQDPNTGKFFVRGTTIDETTGIPKVSWTPVSPNSPIDKEKEFKNAMFESIMGEPQNNPTVSTAAPSTAIPFVTGQGVTPQGMKKQVNKRTGEVRYVPR